MLPLFFSITATLMLIGALLFLWRSLRAAFGAADSFHLPSAEAESRRILEERKTALLANLADLEFEHAGGKISDEDYEALDKKLRVEAKRVLRLLDDDVKPYRAKAETRLKGHMAERGAPYRRNISVDEVAADDRPEDPVSVTKEDVAKEDVAKEDVAKEDVADVADAAPPAEGEQEEQTSNACKACETVNDADAAFCKKCGASMEAGDDGASDDDDVDKNEGDAEADGEQSAPKEDA